MYVTISSKKCLLNYKKAIEVFIKLKDLYANEALMQFIFKINK
ncbi:hypothetical protein Bint_1694 [Brachyspira intermedia PWS/A]|uniref:Uncharacterized protein n=1 Tax=Brachyspira intermedia (strain ATCC 51140 / PWS/A) TaxID=1045858 RepID=G0EIW1_BRAIP|nr:hypothetical protein Bint_1694 [Brachyspira intermedia PWS/A]